MTLRFLFIAGMVAAIVSAPAQAARQIGTRQSGGFAPTVPPLLVRAIKAQPFLRYTGSYTSELRTGATTVDKQEFIIRSGEWYRIDYPSDSKFAGHVIIENNLIRQHY